MRQQKSHSWWRPILTGMCIVIAAVALVGSVAARYLQRNVLDTDGYLAVVGPLPKDPAVAAALARFTTQRIFDTANTEATIRAFLPPKLAPLSDPLAETLQKRFNQRTNDFIQSDTFTAIWTTSNRLMQKGVVRIAESKEGQPKLAAVGSLDLGDLATKARERFGGQSDGLLTNQQKDKLASLPINLRQRVDRLRTAYLTINSGAYVLPYVAAAFLPASLAVAYNRRRALLAIGASVLLVGVAGLLFFKIASGTILGEITDPISKAAAETVYQAFYADLRARLVLTVVLGGILAILAVLAGPYRWAEWLRDQLSLSKLKNIRPYHWAVVIRRLASKYELWIGLAGAMVAIIWMLALSTLTAATLGVIGCLLLTYVSLLHLIARPAPARAAGVGLV